MIVLPSANAAITAIIGISSINRGIMLPSIVIPFKEEVRTKDQQFLRSLLDVY
jgi:hypothetical protein